MELISRDLRRIGLPHVVKVARERRDQAVAPLSQHRHRGRFELVYLAEGAQSYAIQNVGSFTLRGGNALLTLPSEVHPQCLAAAWRW